jgi:phage tail-like protein
MSSFGSALGRMVDDTLAMSHHFIILIDNPAYNLGFWQRASGLSVKWDTCTYRLGNQGNEFWIYPGTTKYENIKLSRAASPASTVVQQWLAATSANAQPLSGMVQLVGALSIPIMQWRLYQFFPVSWSVSEFSAPDAKTVMETLELAHTGFLDDQIMAMPPL